MDTYLQLTSGADKVVFAASTSEVCGKSTQLPFCENGDVVPGATSKGRWFYACAKAIEPLAYFRQRRRFSYVGDVVWAIKRQILHPRNCGRVFNVGSYGKVSLFELAQRVKARAGSASEIAFVPYANAYDSNFEDMPGRIPDLRRLREAARAALALALGAAALSQRAAAQQAWSFDAATEPSRVSAGARDMTWWNQHLQASYRAGPGLGWYAAADSEHREQGDDLTLSAGGHRRIQDWLLSGRIGAGVQPAFAPRFSVEPQLARLFGNVALQASAVYRAFPQSRVRIGSLAAIVYNGDSEFELKLSYGSTEPAGHRIRVVGVRAAWDRGGAFSYGASVSAGHGLYDAINVPGSEARRGWIVNANVRYRIDAASSVRLDLTLGREELSFRQRALGLSYRREF
ncbi:YaiO family outer membrane beta-barrel protein [Janthinobacterium fluminis]|uniref:YaiO family outer membrane beta-barrel protein n=1 Tax=Janthinobacterium fluminis TaxID=2987524 RepID=A0ABT5K050_9BURK|nr:YaiO family outer membrane beta-barrel protein [Janthinobacterium fluminis]MDC8758349.1 YaiO family outer membrane beta-barrel protein [Janthinobacterium fluminis]